MTKELESLKKESKKLTERLEGQLLASREYEDKHKDRADTLSKELNACQGELDAKTLKIEYLESKIEEKYHMEGLFNQLKDDYDELRKEKLLLIDQTGQIEHRKLAEIKALLQEKEDLIKENQRFSDLLNSKNIEVAELVQDSQEQQNYLRVASEEQQNLERLVQQKQERLDMYSSEISNLNERILDFGKLMD